MYYLFALVPGLIYFLFYSSCLKRSRKWSNEMSERRDAAIWLVDTNGSAHTLSLEDNKLKPACRETDIIKRISAVGSCAFAVGGDQDVYLYVHSRDVSIRVQVSTYENQRWGLINKWSHESVSTVVSQTRLKFSTSFSESGEPKTFTI